MELAQAGSSDLSPSLLTLMQQGSGSLEGSSSLEGSPSAHEAFQRGEQRSLDPKTQWPPLLTNVAAMLHSRGHVQRSLQMEAQHGRLRCQWA